MLSALLTLLVLGIAGLVVASIVIAIIGTVFSVAFGLAGVLIFKVAPLLILGWVVLKVFERTRSRSRISAADRKWLDG